MKDKNEIKICCPVLGIDPQSNSGGGVHDRDLLKAFAKAGVKVEILIPKNRPYDKTINNWNVTCTPIKHIIPPYLFNIFVTPYLFSSYKRSKFNYIRVFNPYFAGIGALIFKYFHPEVPVLAMYHHLEESKLKKLLDKALLDKWDMIVTPSEFTKKEISEKYNISSKKIAVFYSGVGNEYFPKEKNIQLINKYQLKGKNILLFLGGLKKRKNVSFLIELMTEIGDNTILLICGAGEEENTLKAKTKELGVSDKVIFTGFVKENEKNDYYNLADIILFPTLKEGFGLMPLEAGLCGKPTIASKVASVPEVILDGKTGLLANLNERKDWLEKINRLINDKEYRISMGNFAYEYSKKMYVEKFNWDIIAEKYIKLFKSLGEK